MLRPEIYGVVSYFTVFGRGSVFGGLVQVLWFVGLIGCPNFSSTGIIFVPSSSVGSAIGRRAVAERHRAECGNRGVERVVAEGRRQRRFAPWEANRVNEDVIVADGSS